MTLWVERSGQLYTNAFNQNAGYLRSIKKLLTDTVVTTATPCNECAIDVHCGKCACCSQNDEPFTVIRQVYNG